MRPNKRVIGGRLLEDKTNTSQCTVCFGTYDDDVTEQTGRDWLERACNRWLHEECVMGVVIDPSEQERLCPFCLDIFDCIDYFLTSLYTYYALFYLECWFIEATDFLGFLFYPLG